MNKLFKSFPSKSSALAVLAGAAASAHAALPASVETDIGAAKTDALAALALMITCVVAIWGLRKVMSLFGR